MSSVPPELATLARFLPEERVGTVTGIEPIALGLSGAGVYAVHSTRGELILRVQPERADATQWTQPLLILRRAAERGVAPAIVHVDEAARAIVSARVAGVPLAVALADPAQRGMAIASVVAQLRTLHALDGDGVERRDPLVYLRAQHAAQGQRLGFPSWAAGLEPLIDAIATTLERDARLAVSHNDVNPGNILWDGTRAWLVDWEVAGLTHPFYDLATLAMFLQLDDGSAHGLLAQHEQRDIDNAERDTFAALRQLSALLCGLTLLGLVPDLGVLPASPPALSAFYAELRAGRVDLQDPRGRGTFGLALLKVGLSQRR
jgi:aminoglycoside phosphotransferase (APT) family kinase protein